MDMIWDFKQRLFVSQRRASLNEVADFSNLVVRDRLQGHIDSLEGMPAPGDTDEYAALFEKVYPSESDRRAYLSEKLTTAKPSYGHMTLATMPCPAARPNAPARRRARGRRRACT